MDILQIIRDNLPELPEGVTISDKALKAIEKEIKAQQGVEFVPKAQYSKKTDRITELEAELSDYQGKSADGEAYKTKYDNLKSEFDTYKTNKETEITDLKKSYETEKQTAAKRNLAKKVLKEKGVHEDVLEDFMLDKIEYDKMEMDDKGIKDVDKFISMYQERYSKYFGTTTTQGANVATPPVIQSNKPQGAKDMNAFIRGIAE